MNGLLGHLLVAPVLLPLFSAALIIWLGDTRRMAACRSISLGTCVAVLIASLLLLGWAGFGVPAVYELGNWPAPYGIVLVLDRLSALLLTLTSVLSIAATWFAIGGWDRRGRHFHALLQLQLMGLNGAFLTGDLFNLFVFFELLLIASYGLMLHGGGVLRQRATLHYIVYNLTASILFLFAVSLLYGVTGTLNMADLALQVSAASTEDAMLVQSAGLLLIVVFAVKAAVLPLGFWLRDGYAAASPPVACLFAMMTKVGIYTILRVSTLVFGDEAGVGANLGAAWLMPIGIATLAMASIGALASRNLSILITYLVVASVGSMLIGVGAFSQQGISAALFYMVHSTFAIALLFLLAGEISHERAALGTELIPGPAWRQRGHIGPLFLLGAVAVAGLPPISGFIAKVGIMQGAIDADWSISAWLVVILSSLLVLIALARSGSMLFWHSLEPVPSAADVAASPHGPVTKVASSGPAWMLALALLALTAGAAPVQSFLDSTSHQLLHPEGYIEAVIHSQVDDDSQNIDPDAGRLRTRLELP